jgi:hypothetical protein
MAVHHSSISQSPCPSPRFVVILMAPPDAATGHRPLRTCSFLPLNRTCVCSRDSEHTKGLEGRRGCMSARVVLMLLALLLLACSSDRSTCSHLVLLLIGTIWTSSASSYGADPEWRWFQTPRRATRTQIRPPFGAPSVSLSISFLTASYSSSLLTLSAPLQVMSPPVLAVARSLAPQPKTPADASAMHPMQSIHPLKSTRSRRGTINAACRECRLKKLKVSSRMATHPHSRRP